MDSAAVAVGRDFGMVTSVSFFDYRPLLERMAGAEVEVEGFHCRTIPLGCHNFHSNFHDYEGGNAAHPNC